MVQYLLSKEAAGKLLDQQSHAVAMTQDIRHSTQNFMQMTRDYLRMKVTFSKAMETRPLFIDCFKCKYDKAFTGHNNFGTDIVD